MALLAIVNINDFYGDGLICWPIKSLADDPSVALAYHAGVFEVRGHDYGYLTVLLEVCDAG